MKNIFFSIVLLIFLNNAFGQKIWLNSFAGISNYQGELQDKSFTFDQSHFAAGLGFSYEITAQLSASANLKIGKISGDDSKTLRNKGRNLNFTSAIQEFSLGLSYDILDLSNNKVSPYVFGGLAVFHYNPYTNDTLGNRVYLQPLGTEGQGINGKKKYSKTQISIPFGAGVKFAITDNVHLGIEAGLRKTFTDYLDDVSSNYADKNILMENNGSTAVALAFRGGELKNGATYPLAGSLRGNAKTNDLYYFTGITLSFRLGGEKMMGSGTKGKMGCPAAL